ncbi:MAG: hypothetical protein Q9227_005544 [Pyrenula ochraceoflavens]
MAKAPNMVRALNTVSKSLALVHRNVKTASVLRYMAASNTDNKAVSLANMMQATRKATQDTSEYYLVTYPRVLLTVTSDQSRGYDQGQQHQQYGQGYDPANPQHQQNPNAPYDPNAPEGERGLGGALAGGAAGAFFGHKQGHGVLGTIGGAIMGSLAQDKFKDHGKHGKHHGKSSWGGYGR